MTKSEYHGRAKGATFKERRRNRKVAQTLASLNWPMITYMMISGTESSEAESRGIIDLERRELVVTVITDETVGALGGLDQVTLRVVEAKVDHRLDLAHSEADWDKALRIVGYTAKRVELFPELRDPSSTLDSIQGYGPASAKRFYDMALKRAPTLLSQPVTDDELDNMEIARASVIVALTVTAGLTNDDAIWAEEWVQGARLTESLYAAFQAMKPGDAQLARSILLDLLMSERAPQELISSVEGDRS